MSNLRYERKYYVRNDQLEALRNRLLPFVNPDVHAKTQSGGLSQYTVRSIYYDTPLMEYYDEKMEGLELRSKYRIRVYDQPVEGAIAFLEIKKKLGNRIKKHRAVLPYTNLLDLVRTGDVEKYVENTKKFPNSVQDAKRFLYYFYKKSLRPVNLITYDREAYHGKFDSGVRITFDKNVRSSIYPCLEELFSENRAKVITPGYFILEVKYFHVYPLWAHSMIEEFGLRHEAISKFSTGVDVHYVNSSKRFSPISSARVPFYKR
ncbi:MAG: VTC domain-containing protein [Cytophagaceae bacterium]